MHYPRLPAAELCCRCRAPAACRELQNKGLTGSITPNGWAQLSSLQRIDLFNNALGGELPSGSWLPPNLLVLDLSGASFMSRSMIRGAATGWVLHRVPVLQHACCSSQHSLRCVGAAATVLLRAAAHGRPACRQSAARRRPC